ncbi:hypothetical protein CDCA_CDCA08G2455 [Cyanidium caldarium]|uniref:Uncharacterized protein n=1 Tax=Cyanidium caldarium TaxID=2771 RepID=A0AAV9IWF5_CYACA|nr:hypothetical protein CDCA_CDCA08G2455 [Cyanidium caldarium]
MLHRPPTRLGLDAVDVELLDKVIRERCADKIREREGGQDGRGDCETRGQDAVGRGARPDPPAPR